MHAQLITYRITGLTHEQYLQQMVAPDAEIFANSEDLVAKTWLGDEHDDSYGGFYVWTDRAAMERFMASPFVDEIVRRPFVSDVKSVDWPVNAAPSALTRGAVDARTAA